jgi:DNA methylase
MSIHVGDGWPGNGRYTEEGEECSTRRWSAGCAAPASARGAGLGRKVAQYWRDIGCTLEFIRSSPDDRKPQYWREPAESRMADTVWTGVPIYSSEHKYPTEKNEAFIAEVLRLASREGDLALDCFCGSGTTLLLRRN